MEYMIIFVVVAAVFVQEISCKPDWKSYFFGSHIPQEYHHVSTSLPPSTHNVFLADTHDVATAKEAHLSALAAHGFDLGHTVHGIQGYTGHHTVQEHKPYHGPIAVPLVLASGHLADTPEVAAAKGHHLAAVAQTKADKYYGGHAEYGYGGAYGYTKSYHGFAVPVVLPSGHIADTHEVAAAKSAHLLAVAKAKADKYYSGHGEGYGYGGGYGYSGSYHGYGVPVVLPDGHLADTHEVAAAKSAHLTAVALAKAEQALSHHHHVEDHHHDDQQHSFHQLSLPELSHVPIYVLHEESHYLPSHESHYLPNHESPSGDDSAHLWTF